MIKTELNFSGDIKLTNTLKGIADFSGRQWKERTFKKAGPVAMKILTDKANSLAPVGKTRLASQSQVPSRGNYTASYKYDYAIFAVLSEEFKKRAPKNRKGQVVRYPYMLAAGIPAGEYERVRNGVTEKYHRRKAQAPERFISKAAKLTESSVIKKFESIVIQELDAYVKRQKG